MNDQQAGGDVGIGAQARMIVTMLLQDLRPEALAQTSSAASCVCCATYADNRILDCVPATPLTLQYSRRWRWLSTYSHQASHLRYSYLVDLSQRGER